MNQNRQLDLNGTIDSVEDSVFDKSIKPMLMMTDKKSERSLGEDMIFDTS
jgi:hypothetical protein